MQQIILIHTLLLVHVAVALFASVTCDMAVMRTMTACKSGLDLSFNRFCIPVLYFCSISALTLLFGYQEAYPLTTMEKTSCSSSNGFPLGCDKT